MDNNEVYRGEVYWINTSDAIGGEEKTGRPGVIISSDYGNENMTSVIIAYTTTQQKYGRVYPYIHVSGYRTWVLCNQLRTIDKSRIEKYIGTLTEAEMAAVERGIQESLSLREDDSVKEEVASLKEELECRDFEIEKLRRMYERVLDELVAMKVESDVSRAVAAVVEGVAVVEEPEEEVVVFAPNKVEKSVVAESVVDEPVDVVDEPDPEVEELWDELEDGIEPKKVTPAPIVKVNINTASPYELQKVGFNNTQAFRIIHNRKMTGPFRDIDELVEVDGIKKKDIRKLRDLLLV